MEPPSALPPPSSSSSSSSSSLATTTHNTTKTTNKDAPTNNTSAGETLVPVNTTTSTTTAVKDSSTQKETDDMTKSAGATEKCAFQDPSDSLMGVDRPPAAGVSIEQKSKATVIEDEREDPTQVDPNQDELLVEMLEDIQRHDSMTSSDYPQTQPEEEEDVTDTLMRLVAPTSNEPLPPFQGSVKKDTASKPAVSVGDVGVPEPTMKAKPTEAPGININKESTKLLGTKVTPLANDESSDPPMQGTNQIDVARNPHEATKTTAASWASTMQMNAAELLEAAAQAKAEANKKQSRPESRKKKKVVPAKSIKKRFPGTAGMPRRTAAKSVLAKHPEVTHTPEFIQYMKSKGKDPSPSVLSAAEFIQFRKFQDNQRVAEEKERATTKEQAKSDPGKLPSTARAAKRPALTKRAAPPKKVRAEKKAAAKGNNTSKSGERTGAEEIWSGVPDEPLLGGWPEGWTKKVFKRASGATKGGTDRYWYTPVAKRKLRSMAEVKRFMTALKKVGGDEEEAWRAVKRG